MINTILTTLFNSWNTQSKCGKCWKFVKTFNDNVNGLTNLYLPTKEDKCCTHIFMEGMTIRSYKSEGVKSYVKEYCDYQLHFKILEQSNFQHSKADEHGCNDSIFDKIVEPLMDCISCDFETDLCALIDYNSDIFNEVSTPIFSKGDYNWAGLDYRLTLRVYD